MSLTSAYHSKLPNINIDTVILYIKKDTKTPPQYHIANKKVKKNKNDLLISMYYWIAVCILSNKS